MKTNKTTIQFKNRVLFPRLYPTKTYVGGTEQFLTIPFSAVIIRLPSIHGIQLMDWTSQSPNYLANSRRGGLQGVGMLIIVFSSSQTLFFNGNLCTNARHNLFTIQGSTTNVLCTHPPNCPNNHYRHRHFFSLFLRCKDHSRKNFIVAAGWQHCPGSDGRFRVRFFGESFRRSL